MSEDKLQKDIDEIKEHDINLGIENLKADISNLRTDLSELSNSIKEKGKGYARITAEKVIQSIGTELDKLGEDKEKVIAKLQDELQGIQDKSKESIESVEDKIQENPLKSVLVAFLAGLFIGKIFDRK